jgi:hypothetical protein
MRFRSLFYTLEDRSTGDGHFHEDDPPIAAVMNSACSVTPIPFRTPCLGNAP